MADVPELNNEPLIHFIEIWGYNEIIFNFHIGGIRRSPSVCAGCELLCLHLIFLCQHLPLVWDCPGKMALPKVRLSFFDWSFLRESNASGSGWALIYHISGSSSWTQSEAWNATLKITFGAATALLLPIVLTLAEFHKLNLTSGSSLLFFQEYFSVVP